MMVDGLGSRTFPTCVQAQRVKIKTTMPKPESGLDCLICAILDSLVCAILDCLICAIRSAAGSLPFPACGPAPRGSAFLYHQKRLQSHFAKVSSCTNPSTLVKNPSTRFLHRGSVDRFVRKLTLTK